MLCHPGPPRGGGTLVADSRDPRRPLPRAHPRRLFVGLLGAALVCFGGLAPHASFAKDPGPIERLARDLGTPKLGWSKIDDATSHVMLEFVRRNETVHNWNKLFTVNMMRVSAARTDEATRDTALRYRSILRDHGADVRIYDMRHSGPAVCYFEFTQSGEINVGAIYSPEPGTIAIEQVAARRPGTITKHDVHRIRQLVNYPDEIATQS